MSDIGPRVLCRFRRHAWTRHPEFLWLPVRRCARCGRVESRAFTGVWRRKRHLEARS